MGDEGSVRVSLQLPRRRRDDDGDGASFAINIAGRPDERQRVPLADMIGAVAGSHDDAP